LKLNVSERILHQTITHWLPPVGCKKDMTVNFLKNEFTFAISGFAPVGSQYHLLAGFR
jgi:hypothetical protein